MHHEEAHHMCKGEGEGSRGGSVDEREARGEMCGGEWGWGGGGWVYEVTRDTCKGEGGAGGEGMSMDDVSANISKLRRLGRPRS